MSATEITGIVRFQWQKNVNLYGSRISVARTHHTFIYLIPMGCCGPLSFPMRARTRWSANEKKNALANRWNNLSGSRTVWDERGRRPKAKCLEDRQKYQLYQYLLYWNTHKHTHTKEEKWKSNIRIGEQSFVAPFQLGTFNINLIGCFPINWF